MAYEWLKKRLGKKKNGLMTQADLARHLGVPDNYMSKLFSGDRQIQVEEILPIARFFDISAEEVLTGNAPLVKSSIKKQEIEVGNTKKAKFLLSIESV